MSTIKVLVADDDETMRRAMVDVLAVYGGFEVVGEVASGERLAELASDAGADLVVLDVRMPEGGPAACRGLRTVAPAPVVVAVSASNDVTTVTEMLRAGATGFLSKGSLGTTFADDLARCARGHVVVAVPQGAHVPRSLGARPADEPDS